MARAYIVGLCGIDGAGKSSVHAALRADPRFASARFVAKRHRDNIELLRDLEPDAWADEATQLTGEYAEAIRWGHGYDFLRFYEDEVAPYLTDTPLIVSDRWTVCSSAYARCGTAAGQDIDLLLSACVDADLLIYLEVEPAEAIRRITARPDGCNSDETDLILDEYRRGYETVLATTGSAVVRVRNDDLNITVEEVAGHILRGVPRHTAN